MKKMILSLWMMAFVIGCTPDNSNILEKNKKLVTDFYTEVLFEGKHDAIDKYIGDIYIQHNPMVADGKNALLDLLKKFAPKDGEEKPLAEIVRVIAENDLVVLHIKNHKSSKDNGSAVVDIFRVKDGKIVEHWDVIQAVPEQSANNNTMF